MYLSAIIVWNRLKGYSALICFVWFFTVRFLVFVFSRVSPPVDLSEGAAAALRTQAQGQWAVGSVLHLPGHAADLHRLPRWNHQSKQTLLPVFVFCICYDFCILIWNWVLASVFIIPLLPLCARRHRVTEPVFFYLIKIIICLVLFISSSFDIGSLERWWKYFAWQWILILITHVHFSLHQRTYVWTQFTWAVREKCCSWSRKTLVRVFSLTFHDFSLILDCLDIYCIYWFVSSWQTKLMIHQPIQWRAIL